MPPPPPNQPQQDLDTGVFFEGPVPQQTADIIGGAVKITKVIVTILHRLGIVSTHPKSPIHIRQAAGNQVEVKLTLAHGTIKEIQDGIEAAIKVIFATIGFSLLAGGVIGYSCSRATMDDSPRSSFSELRPK